MVHHERDVKQCDSASILMAEDIKHAEIVCKICKIEESVVTPWLLATVCQK